MNFQAVSVGEKLVEKSLGETGGYVDPFGTPSNALIGEMQFVDGAIGQMVYELKKQGLYDSTLIIVSAKHGQSPIDPNRVLRIPADNPAQEPPSQVLSPRGVGPGLPVVQADEDDISMLWLTDQSQTASCCGNIGLPRMKTSLARERFSPAPSLTLYFNDPLTDSRTPDIIVAPNVGVIYTGGTGKVAEHGGFADDDRNVMLMVSNPKIQGLNV